MSDPPTKGTTTAPSPDYVAADLVAKLKGDLQIAAIQRNFTAQLVDQPRQAVQGIVASLLEVVPPIPFLDRSNAQTLDQVSQDLTAPVKSAKVIANASVKGVDATRPGLGADPIELATGQLLYTTTDLSLDGGGIRFEFSRTYRSQARYPNGPLGASWDHNYNLWLREVDANTIVVGSGQLREDRYHRISPGGVDPDYFAADAGNDSILLLNARTQKYELRVPGGVTYQFAPLGAFHAEDAGLHRLERTFDRFQVRNAISGAPELPGNYLLFSYDLNDTHLLRAIEVNHPTRLVTLNYDDLGRIIALTDYVGRRVTYLYDDYDDLVAVTLPATQDRRYGRTTFYEYSSAESPILHLLTSVLDADGRRYLEVEYGLQEGFTNHQRVIRQRDNEGEWLLQYADLDVSRDPNDPPDPDLPVRYTWVVQPNGHEVEYWFNELGGVLFKADRYLDSERVPQRALWRYQYNPDGKLIASLSPEGVFVQHCYFRDEYALGSGLHVADSIQNLVAPTATQRRAFGMRTATVRRARAPVPLLTWPDPAIADGILNATADDMVQRFEWDPDTQLPLRASDPRATADLVGPPTRWLIEYQYSPDVHRFPVSIVHPAVHRPDGTPGPVAKEYFVCDPNGRVVAHKDPEGHTARNVYYQDADPPLATDKDFGVEHIPQPNPLSPSGHLASTTRGLGEPNASTQQFRVNRRGIPTETIDALGGMTQQVLDSSDKPIEASRFLTAGVTYNTRSRYTGQAKVFRTEAAILDDNGAPVLVDGQPLGSAVRRLRYTDIEQIRSESVGGANSATFLTTRYGYDCSGLQTKSYSPGDSVTRLQYDSRRLPSRSSRGYGTPEAIEVRTFYDRDGRSIATMDGRGCVVRAEYDGFGRKAREIQVVDRLVGAIDARPLGQRLGHTKATSYDKLDNVVLERFFQWRPGDTYELLSRTGFEFDERGRKIKEIRDVFPQPIPAGAEGLDAFAKASPAGAGQIETWIFLDENGREIDRRDGVVLAGPSASLGSCVQTSYDHSGRPTVSRVVLLDQNILEVTRTESTYDLNGNLLRTDQFDFEHDNNGVLLRTEVISHAFQYDVLNRKVADIDGLGNRTTSRYDSRGLKLETMDAVGNRILFNYDLYGRNVRVKESPAPTKTILSTFEFDADGQTIAVIRGDETNPALTTIRYRYNAANKKIAEIRGLGTILAKTTQWRYDAAGNETVVIQPSSLTYRMSYDRVNRLEQVEFDATTLPLSAPPLSGASAERFEHDGLGRVILAETDQGAATLTSVATKFNSLGQATVEVQSLQGEADLTIRRSFDPLGHCEEIRYSSDHRFRFHFDLAGRLERVEDTVRGTPNVGLPGAGARDVQVRSYVGVRRRSETFASGVQTIRAYDRTGRLIGLDHQSAGNVSLLNLMTLYDGAANVRMEWQAGAQVLHAGIAYTFDGLNRLDQGGATGAGVPNAAAFAPPAGPVNPLVGQGAVDALIKVPAAVSRSYQYDAGGNRVSETVGGSNTPVDVLDQQIGPTYDETGNPVGIGAAKLSFDARNRLVGWNDGATKVDTIYDALGRRVLVDTLVAKKRFAYDGVMDVAEYRNGQLFSESLVSVTPDGRSILFCQKDEFVIHSDRIGSTRMVTNSTRAVVGRYDFDPYGQMDVASIDLPIVSHRFMGREWDGEIALYHFRARHYDPSIGTFLQRDPASRLTIESPYRAFASNPLIYIDPMGTTPSSHTGDAGPALKQALIPGFFDHDYWAPPKNNIRRQEMTWPQRTEDTLRAIKFTVTLAWTGAALTKLGALLYGADEFAATMVTTPPRLAPAVAEEELLVVKETPSPNVGGVNYPHWEGSISRYGVRAPGFERHEGLPNMIIEDAFATTRGVGPVSRENPVMLLSRSVHTDVTTVERALSVGFRNQIYGSGLKTEQIMQLKAEALLAAGVPIEDVLHFVEVGNAYADGLGLLKTRW